MNEFNQEILQKHKEYLDTGYRLEPKKNQGLEELFETINNYSDGDTWIDLGSGATSFLWNIPMKKKKEIIFSDLDLEVEVLIKQLQDERFNKGCFKYAFQEYPENSIFEVYNQSFTYYSKDLLNKKINFEKKYDLITQFGLLGLCKDRQHFIEKTEEIMGSLNTTGTYIGANWIYSNKRVLEKKHDNRFIDSKLINYIAEKLNLTVEVIKDVQIENDDNFDSVIIYVLKKKPLVSVGFQQIFDCYDVEAKNMSEVKQIKQIIHALNSVLDHKILKEEYYQFEPQGITGFAIISGSHIAIHTWPEYNYLSIDVFSCYNKKEKNIIIKEINKILRTKNIITREFSRDIKIGVG